MTWKTKIKILLREIKQLPYSVRDYGIRYAFYCLLNNVSYFCPQSFQSAITRNFRNSIRHCISKYLPTDNASYIHTYIYEPLNVPKIFVFWWQGFDNAPQIVKACVESIKRNMKGQIVLLDKHNYNQWADIPDYILEKLQLGEMTMAAFSDVLRFALLSRHAGLWMDATLFCSEQPPQWIYEADFVTRKGEYNDCIVSAFRWTGFFIGGKSNELQKLVYDIICRYWKNVGKHGRILDYFLVDYILDVIYDNIELYRTLIDSVPVNNLNIHTVEELLNEPYDGFFSDTWLYKLTYKKKFVEYVDDKSTYYKVICDSML